MSTSRRNFLVGLGVTIAAPAIAHAANLMPIKPDYPTIYGDGFHCDADGIRAFLRGDRVQNFAGLVRLPNGSVFFPANNYLVLPTIHIPKGIAIEGSRTERPTFIGSSVSLSCGGENTISHFGFRSTDLNSPALTLCGQPVSITNLHAKKPLTRR